MEIDKQQSKITLVILAAGKGSRYGGMKQLDAIGPSGETIMDYAIFDAIRAGFTKIVFVIRSSFEQEFNQNICQKFKGIIEVTCVFQELNQLPKPFILPIDRVKPWGTAHALLSAKNVVQTNFAMINADDFYGAKAFEQMAKYLQDDILENSCLLLSYKLKNTLSKFGYVSRGVCQVNENNRLISLEEHTRIFQKEDKIVSQIDQKSMVELLPDTKVSMNLLGFTPKIFSHIENLFLQFLEQNIDDLTAEFYIPWVMSSLNEAGKLQVNVQVTDEKWIGVTYAQDKAFVVAEINRKVADGLYPKSLFN